MKYTYAYKTSDGVRHEDSMHASSREEVFECLRAKGIKAIKVVAADGSKANGEVRGVRLRVVAALLALAAAAGVAAYVGGTRSAKMPSAAAADADPVRATPRHQIYGDPAIMETLERGEFGKVLPREGDRLLAIFAQPGKLMCGRGMSPQDLAAEQCAVLCAYANGQLAAEHDIKISPGEPRESMELKQIVNGMRDEMRRYLANGNGTPRSYWRRLNERTLQEMQIFERTRRELERETSPDIWEEKNSALRKLGIRTIANPNE